MDTSHTPLDLDLDLEPPARSPLPTAPLPQTSWAPTTNHDSTTNGHTHQPTPTPARPQSTPTLDSSNLPQAPKSLSGISLRAFLLGLTLGTSLLLTLHLLSSTTSPLWRIPFFLSTLSLFHFLEYWTTATYNTRFASISAFLLSQNGSAYNVAHTAAVLECLLAHLLFPDVSWLGFSRRQPALIALGLAMIVVGQATRTAAMAQAGSNFNHTLQMKRDAAHELVTGGIYGWLRHPSYFGFFWWGLGTQVVLGNGLCLVGYTAVLWKFFSARIKSMWVSVRTRVVFRSFRLCLNRVSV
jgi:protein-S-isoprenylcysteine O-methyltransferase